MVVGLALGLVVGALWIRGSSARALSAAQASAAEALAQEQSRASAVLATEQAARASAEAKLSAIEEHGKTYEQTAKVVSQEVLAATTKQLQEAFNQQRLFEKELAEKDALARTKAIDDLVKPVGEKLDRFRDRIDKIEKDRSELDGKFEEKLKQLGLSVETLGTRTTNLVDALKKPNVRGAWGELQLRSVIERAGMNSYCDFVEQATTVTSDGTRQRPDVLVKLPGDKLIVIDAKVPLDAFLAAQEAETEEAAQVALARHARQVRDHIKTLAAKRYQDQFDNSADLVVMFLPNEGIYHGALDADRELFDFAVDQNVLIATPTTLIALLRAVNYGWTQERLAKSAREIAAAGAELHSRIINFANGFVRVGKNLDTTVKNYNKALGTLEGRVVPQIARLEALDAKGARELEERQPAVEIVRTPVLAGLSEGRDVDESTDE